MAKIEARLDGHLSNCERRYQEGSQRMDKLIDFIQKAHSENRKDIGEIKDTLAEQRGAGKAIKIIGGIGAAVIGGISGLVGGHFGR